jgi:hypothetical protein
MQCPKCISKEYVKSGFNKGNQRYKCKKCSCNFTKSYSRNYSFKIKFQAAKLYLEGMGFRSIGRVLGISNVTVLNWIRDFGILVKKYVQSQLPEDIYDVDVAEIDEMWHFTQKKAGSSGFGLQSSEQRKTSLDFRWEAVVEKPSRLS